MLKKLRNKKTAKKVWIILAIVVLPPFILWGTGSLIGDKNKDGKLYAGKIYGRKVPMNEFNDALAAVRGQMMMQLGESFSQLAPMLNLKEQAWERLLLLAEIKRRKISVPDKEVVEMIQKSPYFFRNDKFNEEAYKQILRYVLNMQPRQYEEQVRKNIALGKLYEQISGSPKLSDEEIKKEYEKNNEQLSVEYLTSLPADFTQGIAVEEKELREYFEANKLDFKEPLSFNLEYVTAESEEALKDPSLAKKETGLFPETAAIPGVGWSAQISGLILKAKPGEELPVINLDKNYYLIWLKERKEPSIPDFARVKEKVKEIILKKKADTAAKEKIEAAAKKLHSGEEDFEGLAKEFGLKASSTELFKADSYIEGIGSSDLFWNTAKALPEKTASEVLSLASGHYIIKLKSRQPIDENKFKEEKEALSQKLSAQKKEEIFKNFLEELKKKAQRYP